MYIATYVAICMYTCTYLAIHIVKIIMFKPYSSYFYKGQVI